jgi:hypothetical protein
VFGLDNRPQTSPHFRKLENNSGSQGRPPVQPIDRRRSRSCTTSLLPASETGHWLEVVIASDDFQLKQQYHHIFLPRIGASYVCPCKPHTEHTCDSDDRLPYLFVSLRAPALNKLLEESPITSVRRDRRSTPKRFRSATLRIAVYSLKNLHHKRQRAEQRLPTDRPHLRLRQPRIVFLRALERAKTCSLRCLSTSQAISISYSLFDWQSFANESCPIEGVTTMKTFRSALGEFCRTVEYTAIRVAATAALVWLMYHIVFAG